MRVERYFGDGLAVLGRAFQRYTPVHQFEIPGARLQHMTAARKQLLFDLARRAGQRAGDHDGVAAAAGTGSV